MKTPSSKPPYHLDYFAQSHGLGDWVVKVNVVSRAGSVLATCNTERSAKRILVALLGKERAALKHIVALKPRFVEDTWRLKQALVVARAALKGEIK